MPMKKWSGKLIAQSAFDAHLGDEKKMCLLTNELRPTQPGESGFSLGSTATHVFLMWISHCLFAQPARPHDQHQDSAADALAASGSNRGNGVHIRTPVNDAALLVTCVSKVPRLLQEVV